MSSIKDMIIGIDELNRIHYDLGGTFPLADDSGHLDPDELGSFVFALEQKLRPKQTEIPGQLSLFDAEEYTLSG